mmetsp:Transcript_60812/g.143186  ORF Transcript_60812/g.143186 Transcript_60812/m.143186 type:complete len:97 (+) Transcript_60812:25-315(+)
MFADVVHFQNLFSSDWPAVTLGDSGSESGNNGAVWNYGQNFGGPTKASWTSGADTVHGGGVGMFGTMGVDAPHNWPISYKETETADEEEFADVVGA